MTPKSSDLASQSTTGAGRVAPVPEWADQAIAGATCVLFDFDGPICGLFAGHRAPHIANRLIDWLGEQGIGVPLSAEDRRDPHAVLRRVGAMHRGDSALVRALEQALTEEELHATGSATPTPHVDKLIRMWSERGVPLAIVTNNSALAAARYVEAHGLAPCFDRHIYGRTADLERLKPDPDCLNRALRALGAAPAKSLMIGDTPSDLYAAQRAGVAFLGYAKDGLRLARLREAGAEAVVDSLGRVLEVVERG
ncbi:HAD family hydrolase [Streptomyces sp. NPDC058657]|uniref:HAD family hydrolase n=1 Tax=unclassified Streptomyces TaxID=2593676 RepID=UPI003668264B